MLRIVIVINKASPYRVPVLERLERMAGVALRAIFCIEREPNRHWDLPPLNFEHVVLRQRFATVRGRYIHYNPDVISSLKRFDPDVVITGGFNPTHLYAFAYAWWKGLAHIPMTDGTVRSEQSLSGLHRAVRRFVFARSQAFVSASRGGQRLYESYGIAAERCFESCLCIDNAAYTPTADDPPKRFDFMFCGRIEAVKNPSFALEVAMETAKRLQRKVRILFVGVGSEEERIRSAAALRPDLVEAEFNGFAAQGELPALYRSARLFLFPTLWDSWGVVANEACAAGLPVLVTPEAGVAGELVRDGKNGFVCALDAGQWAERAELLLTQQQLWQDFSRRSLTLVQNYTYDNAALGLLDACRFSLAAGTPRQFRRPA